MVLGDKAVTRAQTYPVLLSWRWTTAWPGRPSKVASGLAVGGIATSPGAGGRCQRKG